MHLGLHSEIREDKENNTHANLIEEALEIHGIKYISTPRPNRRGGGAAITLISDSQFVLTKLNIDVLDGDYSLEVCWGLLKPKNPTGHIKSIIVCAFYSPPNSRKKSALINHISINYFILKSQHPDSAFICGGDKNDLNLQLLLDIDPSFRQIVTKPTYNQSVLEVIVTDIGQYYLEPTIRPAVQPDTHCPTKTVRTSNLDGKVTSVAVKQASRRKNREYVKHGNSSKYKELKKEVKSELKLAQRSSTNKMNLQGLRIIPG